MEFKYKRILLKLSGEAMAEKIDGNIVNPFDVGFLETMVGVIGKLMLSKTVQEAMANLPDRIAGKC